MTAQVTQQGSPSDSALRAPTATEDLHPLFLRWQQDRDRRAREALVERFMPLARSLARRYARSSEPFDDLLQVASLGLLKAIERFDVDRGRAFSSYAVPTILGELRRYFRDCSWSVHVPRGRQEHALQVEAAQRRIAGDRGQPPTVTELSEYLELSEEEVLLAMQASQAFDALSLDAPRQTDRGDEDFTFLDLIGEDDGRYELVDASASIFAAAQHLPERERQILHLRFAHDMTQTEIAARMGISQMQVSRLLRGSLERLRLLTGVRDDQQPNP